jgi:sortase A
VRRVIGAFGRAFVTVGILILLFVAYQLWGTGLYTSRQQEQLRTEFEAQVGSNQQSADSTTDTSEPSPTVTTTTTTPPPPAPRVEGEAVALLRIPKIAVDSVVVEGVDRDDLRKGPGHYPITPLPGQAGNAAIAGHRTTYGAPFGNLDQLTVGDEIVVQTTQGTFTYEVYEEPLVVAPTDIDVLRRDPNLEATLTLTTCNPKYSASQRLIIKAVLQREPLPAPVTTEAPVVKTVVLSGEASSKLPTLIAGLIAALIGALWWLLFHRHPRAFTWLIGAIPFAVSLYFFYVFLERILPANY